MIQILIRWCVIHLIASPITEGSLCHCVIPVRKLIWWSRRIRTHVNSRLHPCYQCLIMVESCCESTCDSCELMSCCDSCEISWQLMSLFFTQVRFDVVMVIVVHLVCHRIIECQESQVYWFSISNKPFIVSSFSSISHLVNKSLQSCLTHISSWNKLTSIPAILQHVTHLFFVGYSGHDVCIITSWNHCLWQSW